LAYKKGDSARVLKLAPICYSNTKRAAQKGVLNLENRKLEFQDEINNRLILTALTLCTGQWGLQYKDMNTLYFGTRRCSTIRVPSQHNPDRTQE
jgi:hypothetical protein